MRDTEVPPNVIKIPEIRIRPSLKSEEEFETLKESIRVLGLHHPIRITENFELIDGELRIRAYKELAAEQPDVEDWKTIPAKLVNKKDEEGELRHLLENGTEYEQDIAAYRLSVITDEEFENQELGKRIDKELDKETLKEYRRGKIRRERIKELLEESEVKSEPIDVSDWL